MSRFSQLYVERAQRIADSPRARQRLAAWCIENFEGALHSIYRAIEVELGYRHRTNTYRLAIPQFFHGADITDVLDACTVIFNSTRQGRTQQVASRWVQFVHRVFAEENLAYRI